MSVLKILRGFFLPMIFIGSQASAAEFTINVGSPISIAKMLSGETGKRLDIALEFQQINAIESHGLAVILPSSTADMKDELFYATKMQEMGYATVVVNGAAPRFKMKFTRSYTSAMIVHDLAKTLNFVKEEFGKPKKVVVLASSTGSLAILASQMEPVITAMPILRSVTHAFMLNAACPTRVVPKLSQMARIFTVNGLQDDSTPAFVCNEMKQVNEMPNVQLLTYQGAHHFESPIYEFVGRVDGAHILPTCTINYDKETKLYVEKRDGKGRASEKDQGFHGMQKWVYKYCLKRGNLQGYNKESASKLWIDVDRLTK